MMSINIQKNYSRQTGFSIIETAIVLVVLGILLGSALYPLGRRLHAEQIDRNENTLQEIRKAVIGYAQSHQTTALNVYFNDTLSKVPAGRPYLPCPDVTGDGIEDRYAVFTNYDGNNPATTLPRSINDGQLITLLIDDPNLLSGSLKLIRFNEIAAAPDRLDITTNNLLLPEVADSYGSCFRDKGAVPWATLGTPPADLWGNRYTYRVDPIFAHSLIGFGNETRSDIYDPRYPLTTTIFGTAPIITMTVMQKRQIANYLQRPSSPYIVDDTPGLVCTIAQATGCTTATPAANILNHVLAANITVFNVSAEATIGRVYTNGDIISGMAFVVVSHGKSAAGALLHQTGQNQANNNLFSLNCSGPPSTVNKSYADPETENIDNVSLCKFIGSNVISDVPTTNSATAAPRNHSFIDLPIHDTATSQFDDQLVYMSDLEVLSALSNLGTDLNKIYIPPGP